MLYKQLLELPDDQGDYSQKRLCAAIKGLPDSDGTSIHAAIHMLILQHYLLGNQTAFNKNKGVLPYQAKTFGQNKGVLYQVENLPEDLCRILYKFLKITTDL
jgi:hypothetical protein